MKVVLELPPYDREYNRTDLVRVPLEDGPMLTAGDVVVLDEQPFTVRRNTLVVRSDSPQDAYVICALTYIGHVTAELGGPTLPPGLGETVV